MSYPAHNSRNSKRVIATQDVATLKAILEEERRTHKQPAIRMHYVIAAWCLIVPYNFWKLWDSVTAGKWGEALGWAALLVLSTQLYRIAQSRTQTKIAKQLARTNDLAAVGVLAEALEWPDTATRKSAIEALTHLLPKMDVSDAGLLNAAQRDCLYRMLQLQNARRYGEFLKAILTAMEQVGDEDALPYIERLASGRATSDAQDQVKAAAKRCMPLLQERIAETRSSRTLLRASAPTFASAAELLRPVTENAPTAPQQLLRASDSQANRND